jgi:hypothetical protein
MMACRRVCLCLVCGRHVNVMLLKQGRRQPGGTEQQVCSRARPPLLLLLCLGRPLSLELGCLLLLGGVGVMQ